MRFASLRTLLFATCGIGIAVPALADLTQDPGQAVQMSNLGTFRHSPLNHGATAVAAVSDEEEEYEFGVLFDAPGVETTYYACAGCHSERIVAQQGLTREHWDELLEWMVEEQGMYEIEEPDRTEILDYLAAHYNEDRPNFPQPAGN